MPGSSPIVNDALAKIKPLVKESEEQIRALLESVVADAYAKGWRDGQVRVQAQNVK